MLSRGQYAEVAADPTDFPNVVADPSSPHVLAAMFGGVRRENPYYTAALADVVAGHPRWRKVCDVADEVVGFTFRGDELYLVTTQGAQNGKVLKTSMSEPSLATAAVAVPEPRP